MPETLPVIAILGGTGALGSALARRWAAAGYPVIIGSRMRDRARALASDLVAEHGEWSVRGEANLDAARAAEIVVIAVPFSNHDAILDEIAGAVEGKTVIDTVVPLVPPKVSLVQLPPRGSAGQIAQDRLGTDVRVVSAFHNIAAAKLAAEVPIDSDVLVFGDDGDARALVARLVAAIGMRAIEGGPIANSVVGEALTSVLIGVNRKYKVAGAGIRITGLPGT